MGQILHGLCHTVSLLINIKMSLNIFIALVSAQHNVSNTYSSLPLKGKTIQLKFCSHYLSGLINLQE